ncbi:hypothetical protein ACFSTE_10390 [Aquimarina hainanensis]|uniref:Transposase n=1 Tax=Aquimarina hainanensis TaxID=1578017 RepID=A0ABW5N6I0_9FLAO|nr:hypothetical protein [Aquimarina sp. TRL1]QKX05723.1 hypothetical protein HN014_12655 [Aquimarina sp. TRL1]
MTQLHLKHFDKTIFTLVIIVLLTLLVPSFLSVFAAEEGILDKDSPWLLFIPIFEFLRFPTHTIAGTYIHIGGAFTFFTGLLLNCMLYAFIIERIIWRIRKQFFKQQRRKRKKRAAAHKEQQSSIRLY